MSFLYQCDGCGKTGEDFAPFGAVITVHYCADCKTRAEAYLAERDTLRVKLVKSFNDGKAVLVARYAINGFKLPDEPAV